MSEQPYSLAAFVETLLCCAAYISIAYYFDIYIHLLVAVMVAPLFLLKTEESMAFGVSIFCKCNNFSRKLLTPVSVFLDKIINQRSRATLVQMITLYFIIWLLRLTCVLHLIFSFLAKFLSTLFICCSKPFTTIRHISTNWLNICFSARLRDTPELVPSLEKAAGYTKLDGAFLFSHYISDFKTKRNATEASHGTSGIIGDVVLLVILFTPAIIYRISLKATCLFYAPLLWVSKQGTESTSGKHYDIKAFRENLLEIVGRAYAILVLILLALPFLLLNTPLNLPTTTLNFLQIWLPLSVDSSNQVALLYQPYHLLRGACALLTLGLYLHIRSLCLQLKEGHDINPSWFYGLRSLRSIFSLITIACTAIMFGLILWEHAQLGGQWPWSRWL